MDINITNLDINKIDELHNKKIVIYGAGVYGTLLYFILDIKGLKNNVICFCVSDSEGMPKNIFGIPVVCIKDISVDLRETTIIVAVSKRDIEAIVWKLRERKIFDYRWFSSISAREARKEIYKKYSMTPIQRNKVFFYCYGGMGYRCNCKYIAGKILEKGYSVEMVWGISDTNDILDMPKTIRTVVRNTDEFFKELYTSAVVIQNSSTDTFVYKREGQFCINTWHGYGPFKKVNAALPEYDMEDMKIQYSYFDLFLTASRFYSQIYRNSFGYEGEVLECGAPRNDIFFKAEGIKEKIHMLYDIPDDKGIILFAPTFRNNKRDFFDKYDFDVCSVLDVMKKRFQKEYIWMYRLHHKMHSAKEGTFGYMQGIDVTCHSDIQELLVAADIVITDYSSLMWDFSLQRKPVFLYQKDLDKYECERGFYAPVSEWPYPRSQTQEELLKNIESFEMESYICNLEIFLEKYGSCDDGHASECVVERIMSQISTRANK